MLQKIAVLSLCVLFWLHCTPYIGKELYRLENLASRVASAENVNAEKGKGGMTNNGLKGSPAIKLLKSGATENLLSQKGPGKIRHIWIASSSMSPEVLRNLILRMYWEDSPIPSVEVPLSDFFGVAHGATQPMYSDLINAQSGRGYNCFIPMPFAQQAKITISNESDADLDWLFYEIYFTLGDPVGKNDGRFHATFKRENPSTYGQDFEILNVENARGVYLGCVFGVRPLTEGWWGEGEVKMYIDGDDQYPTICGTGLEDYFGAAWGLKEHNTATQGAPLVSTRFSSLYRFHVHDPIYFQKNIRITMQQMGTGKKSKLEPLYGDKIIFGYKNHPRRSPDDIFYLRSDDVCCTTFWYQYPVTNKRTPISGKSVRSANLYDETEKDKQLPPPATL